MLSYKTTIVTFFFDLSDLHDATNKTRNFDFYLNHGRSILQLNNPMIIFCDMKTKDKIRKIREEYIGINTITIYVEKNINEYDFYKENYKIIEENRRLNLIYNLEYNKRNTVSYFLTVMFKIIALNIAHKRNDFNTDYYIWMDFGCSYVVVDVVEKSKAILDNPHPKIGVLYIHYRKNELNNMIDFCNKGLCGIASGIMTFQKEYVSIFYCKMMSIFYEQLSRGVGHADEQVLTYCYNLNPEIFTLYYGDYYSLITNYHYPVRDFKSIKIYFLDKTLAAEKTHLALKAANKIYESYEKKLLSLSPDEVIYVKSIIDKYP